MKVKKVQTNPLKLDTVYSAFNNLIVLFNKCIILLRLSRIKSYVKKERRSWRLSLINSNITAETWYFKVIISSAYEVMKVVKIKGFL